jgi:hypothetical protein
MRALLLAALLLVPTAANAAGPPPVRTAVPLAEAIRKFNEEAKRDPVGKEQPPLTLDEVLAAIRLPDKKHYASATDEQFAEFKRIAETQVFPATAEFEVLGWMDPGGDYLYQMWDVRIMLTAPEGNTYSFTVRRRLIRSQSVEEAAAALEKVLRDTPALPGRYRMEDRLKDLKARAAALRARVR